MSVAGVKIRVPRWMAEQAANYLSDGWRPPRRRGACIPGASDVHNLREIDRAQRIAREMDQQIVSRRAFKDRPILIVLRRSDASWLGDNLPRRAPLFCSPRTRALYWVGFVSRVEAGRRRGRRVVWPEEMQRRLSQKNPMIDLSAKQIRRYDLVLQPEDDSDWPDHLKNPI